MYVSFLKTGVLIYEWIKKNEINYILRDVSKNKSNTYYAELN